MKWVERSEEPSERPRASTGTSAGGNPKPGASGCSSCLLPRSHDRQYHAGDDAERQQERRDAVRPGAVVLPHVVRVLLRLRDVLRVCHLPTLLSGSSRACSPAAAAGYAQSIAPAG